MDAKSGQILLSCNPQLFCPPASTLKVMTAMSVVEHLKLDDKVPVSAYAASAPPSKIKIKAGETYTVRELLYALLLSSANGLPAENQFTTAQDLALMFKRAMGNPELARIMATKYYTIQGDRELRNHNRFLFTTPLAVAGKTGYTRASKHTYVGMFQNGDKAIIVAMMGSTKNWADLRPLIEKGFELEGAPIAELPPAEEKLHFPSRLKTVRARAVMGSAVCVPVRKRAISRKKLRHKEEQS